jgi:hypothetical protein
VGARPAREDGRRRRRCPGAGAARGRRLPPRHVGARGRQRLPRPALPLLALRLAVQEARRQKRPRQSCRCRYLLLRSAAVRPTPGRGGGGSTPRASHDAPGVRARGRGGLQRRREGRLRGVPGGAPGRRGAAVRLVPGCGHGFHAECIEAWFRVNSTCPLCRAAVDAAAAAGQSAGEAQECGGAGSV